MSDEQWLTASSVTQDAPAGLLSPSPLVGMTHDVVETLRTWAPQMVDLAERIVARAATVGVIGQGYVGFPLAQQIAARGYRTYGFDTDVRVLLARESMSLEPNYTRSRAILPCSPRATSF